MAWFGLTLILFLQSSPFFPSVLHTAAQRVAPPPLSHPRPLPLGPSPAIKAGYWPSGTYSAFPPSSILPYFTHVFYAFVPPDPNSFELVVSPSDAVMLANFTAALHSHRPPVKAMLSIGGGGSPPPASTFAAIAANISARSAFISSSIAVARKYGLDGLDLDWEYPKDSKEMAGLGELLVEWRRAVEKEAAATSRPRLVLTSAVYFASVALAGNPPRSYPADKVSAELDWVNLMCYDYHGKWDSETGEHAAWYDPSSNISTSYGLTSWIAAGMPREKLVMGLPLYGVTWRLRDPAEHGIGAPAVGVGPGDDGTMPYKEVVDYNRKNKATEVFDRTAVAAYSYQGVNWIGYDNPRSAAMKTEFARKLGLGGYFLWAIGQDEDWSITRTVWKTWMR